MDTAPLGMPSAPAMSLQTALLALPLSGGAVTRTRTSQVPSSATLTPTTWSFPDLGVTCTAQVTDVSGMGAPYSW